MGSPMVITTNGRKIRAFYFVLSAEGFGCRPIVTLYDQLRVVWYPKFQTWGTPTLRTHPLSRVDLTLDQDKVLHVKYNHRRVDQRSNKFKKLWDFPTPPQIQAVLASGLFVESTNNRAAMGNPVNTIISSITSVTCSRDNIMIDQLTGSVLSPLSPPGGTIKSEFS